jgi:peroxiredoxin
LKRNALVFVALFVAVLFMLAGGKYMERVRKHGPMQLVGNVQGVQAPDFHLLTLDGTAVKLSDYRGKAVLLNFWATWCAPCKVEMPWFVELQKQYGKDGLVILGVAMDDSKPAEIARFASEMGVNYPVLLGTDQLSDDYGNVQYLPTTFYIGRSGTIVDKMTGLLDRKDIEEAVKKALNTTSKATTIPQSQANAEIKPASTKNPNTKAATR